MNYEIRKQLEELQRQYYLAIDEAFKAKTVLGEDIFEEMRQDLVDRYRIERDQLKEKAKIPDKNINFETNLKIYELTPHRRGFLWLFKNEARKLKEREVDIEDRIELDARTNDVEELEEKIYGSPELPEEQPEPANVAPPSEPSTAAHGACDATHQNDEQAQKTAANVAEPPAAAPMSEKLKPKAKPKAKPKKATKPNAEPHAPKLSGQIAMDELNNK